jgi:molybdopterin converting factor small subunit
MAVEVTVELYGMPRQRAGRSELRVSAGTAAAALRAAAALCPGLGAVLRTDGGLSRHCLLSLNGREFLTDLTRPLEEGDRLLLLSADAGG